MRTAFMDTLTRLAAEDESIFLVTADLGYSVVERFADAFPDRFLNNGVAEQNMTGIAAGLAMSGYTVFTYSIANFPVMRCLEQIRNDVCYHNLNVKVVAVGGGFSYGSLGYSHHGMEDLAVTRVLPNMTVAAPADPFETEAIVNTMVKTPGPGYLRLGKAGEPRLHAGPVELPHGGFLKVRSGQGVTILSTGGMLDSALKVSQELSRQGVEPTLISVPYLTPLDQQGLLQALSGSELLVTLEEHGAGGLSSVIAERLMETGTFIPFLPLYARGEIVSVAGSQEQLREQVGLGVHQVTARILEKWQK